MVKVFCVKTLKYILSSIWCFWFYIKRDVIINRGSAFFVKIQVAKNNSVYLIKSKIRRSKIFVVGRLNKVIIKGELFNSSISVSGEDNKIYIADSTHIHNLHIVINGKGCNCYIGSGTSFGGARVVCMGQNNSVVVGKNCMFSDNIEIWATDSHPIYDGSDKIINCSESIFIGDNIWVGARVIILKGVCIEKGAIIGMGSVVTKNIEANTINVGNPCKCIRKGVLCWERDYITI